MLGAGNPAPGVSVNDGHSARAYLSCNAGATFGDTIKGYVLYRKNAPGARNGMGEHFESKKRLITRILSLHSISIA